MLLNFTENLLEFCFYALSLLYAISFPGIKISFCELKLQYASIVIHLFTYCAKIQHGYGVFCV